MRDRHLLLGLILRLNRLLSVAIWLPENAPLLRNLTALGCSFSPPVVLPHALASGIVLLLVMTLLCVFPTFEELSCPRGLFVFGTVDAFLHGFRRLSAASVARGSPALGVGGRGQCGQDEKQGNLSKAHFQVERYSGELKSMGYSNSFNKIRSARIRKWLLSQFHSHFRQNVFLSTCISLKGRFLLPLQAQE